MIKNIGDLYCIYIGEIVKFEKVQKQIRCSQK